MSNALQQYGFRGNLAWVHNEEGSGLKSYGTSVYYPDSRKQPRTKSGVTIDPGLDLGNAAPTLIKEVLNYYNEQGLLTVAQYKRLMLAVGFTKADAIEWMEENEWAFKPGKPGGVRFAVRDKHALFVLENYTADDYWIPLVKAMPRLKAIKENYVAEAVHTALLSQSYNRGYYATIETCRKFVEIGDFGGMAFAIKGLKQSTESSRGRRRREAALIVDAMYEKEKFTFTFEDLKPEPLPLITMPLVKQAFLMDFVAVPEKPVLRI